MGGGFRVEFGERARPLCHEKKRPFLMKTPSNHSTGFMRNSLKDSFFPEDFQGQKRHPNTKISPQNPMPESTFVRGLPPPKFSVFGLRFPFEMLEKHKHKEFWRGARGGRKKIFVLDFLGCFFRSLDFGGTVWISAASWLDRCTRHSQLCRGYAPYP